MPYQNFELRHYPLAIAPWYKVTDLLDAIAAVRRINYSLVESRQQALERLNSIPTSQVFGVGLRFSANEAYVCELIGDWGRKFQQIKSSLSFKERTKEMLMKSSTSDVRDKPSDNSDSAQAFWNSTTAMYDQIVRLDGVFDQSKFEVYAGLTWQEIPAPAPVHHEQ